MKFEVTSPPIGCLLFHFFLFLLSLKKYFERLADDLEAYAAHAKRKTIEVEILSSSWEGKY